VSQDHLAPVYPVLELGKVVGMAGLGAAQKEKSFPRLGQAAQDFSLEFGGHFRLFFNAALLGAGTRSRDST
jgi:hypothetical protein